MSIFIMDNEARLLANKMIKNAEENELSLGDTLNIRHGIDPPVGNREGFSGVFKINIRVVYSHQMMQAHQMWRLMSVSLLQKGGKIPNEYVIKELMKLFRFDSDLEDCHVDYPQFGPNHFAFMVGEPIQKR